MAKKTQVIFYDDIDHTEGATTVQFAIDGVSYEIDLSERNAQKLARALEPFITAGRRTSTPKAAQRRTERPTGNLAAIRAWAKDNGYEVSERGRISQNIVEAYELNH